MHSLWLYFKLQIISITMRTMIRKECVYGRHRAKIKKQNLTKKKSHTYCINSSEIIVTWKKMREVHCTAQFNQLFIEMYERCVMFLVRWLFVLIFYYLYMLISFIIIMLICSQCYCYHDSSARIFSYH